MDDHGHKGQGRIPKLGRNPLIRISHMMLYINLTAREFINLNPLSDRIFCIGSGNTYCTWVLGIIWYLSNPMTYFIRSGCDGDGLVLPTSLVSRLHLCAPTCDQTLPPTHTTNTTSSSIMTSNISGFGMAGYLWSLWSWPCIGATCPALARHAVLGVWVNRVTDQHPWCWNLVLCGIHSFLHATARLDILEGVTRARVPSYDDHWLG